MAESLHQGLAQWIQCKLEAVFVKVSFASLGFEPRTFSYPGRCATDTLLARKLFRIRMMVMILIMPEVTLITNYD